jgi:hypothetical protein
MDKFFEKRGGIVSKFDAVHGEKVSIGKCLKMGSISLDKLASLNDNPIKLSTIDLMNNNTHNIVLIRDVLDKWKSGMYEEIFRGTGRMPSNDLLYFLENNYWGIHGIRESLNSEDKNRVKNTQTFVDFMVRLYDWNGTTNINWMLYQHATFWKWNTSDIWGWIGEDSLLTYLDLENYYFLELKDLSNPRFLKWLGDHDSSWKDIEIEHAHTTSPLIKRQFERFWDEYNNETKNPTDPDNVLSKYFLVSPYSNLTDKTIPLVNKLLRETQNIINMIRKSHPRYLKFE